MTGRCRRRTFILFLVGAEEGLHALWAVKRKIQQEQYQRNALNAEGDGLRSPVLFVMRQCNTVPLNDSGEAPYSRRGRPDMQLTDRNLEVGEIIVELTKQPSVSGRLIAALAEAKAILRKDPAKLAASVPIALPLFGNGLPSELKSCRLAVMRAQTAFHVERHPNACQFMLSIEGSGTIILKNRAGSQSSELGSDPSAPLSERWHVIPADTWHQPVPGKKDWAVLAFHSVTAGELIDDYEFPG